MIGIKVSDYGAAAFPLFIFLDIIYPNYPITSSAENHMTSENNQIRISAKNLGSLAMPNVCRRCFWLKMRLGWKTPWSLFPGIFSSIDSYSKTFTLSYFDKYKKLPPWFSPYGDFIKPVPVPHHTRFFIIDEKTNIRLTGVPDDIFLNADGSYSIIDYKTARYSKYVEDELLPMYRVQLNAYSYLAKRNGFSPVSSLLLCYYQPKTHSLTENPEKLDSVLLGEGFMMPFMAHIEKVELKEEEIIEPLLGETRRLGDLQEAPEGREGCEDCRRVGEVVSLL